MGKKGGWISTVKKVLTFESKETKEKRPENLKNKRFNKNDSTETVVALPPTPIKAPEKSGNEQSMHAYSVAIATAAAAEVAAAAARAAAAEIAWLTVSALQPSKSKEEIAAVKIQTAFRGHLARRALRALRGLARLKSMIEGQSVQRQSRITLQCMQTLSRVQSQIQSRRIKMSEENLAFQQHLQQKYEKESEKLRDPAITQKIEKEPEKSRVPASTTYGGDDWNASAGSKEQIEAKLQNKEEAAIRRERALVYAHSHQTVRTSKSADTKHEIPKPENPIFTDQLTDPVWSWSWLERWMGTRPWESKTTQDQNLLTDHQNISQITPPTQASQTRAHSMGPKARPMGPMGNRPTSGPSKHQRRHTIGGTLVKDGKVKSRVASRLGNGKAEKGSFGSAKSNFLIPCLLRGQGGTLGLPRWTLLLEGNNKLT